MDGILLATFAANLYSRLCKTKYNYQSSLYFGMQARQQNNPFLVKLLNTNMDV